MASCLISLGEGAGEEQVLPCPVLWQQCQHLADIVDEAHVEHPVGLVQHQDLHPGEIHRPLADVVEEPPRRGHQDIDALAQLLDLRVDLDAAEDHRRAQREVAAVGLHALADLGGQFAGGGENQRAHRALAAGDRVVVQALQQR